MAKRFWKRLSIASLVFGLICLAFLLLAWWRLPDLLNYAAGELLPTLGLDEASLRVSEAGADHLVIEDGLAAGTGWSGSFERLEVHYALADLWRNRRASRVELDGLDLEMRWPKIRQNFPKSDESLPGFDFSWIERLPAEAIEVTDGVFAFQSGKANVDVVWSGTLERLNEGAIAVELLIEAGGAQSTLSGVLRDGGISELMLSARVPDALELLGKIVPKWKMEWGLPDEWEVALGTITLEADIAIDPETALVTVNELRLRDVGIRAGGMKLFVDSATTQIRVEAMENVSGSLNLAIREASVDGLLIASRNVRLAFSGSGFDNWHFSLIEPVRWSHGDFARGAVTASADIALDDRSGEMSIDAMVGLVGLSVAGEDIAPFEMTIAGDTRDLAFGISPVFPSNSPSTRLHDAKGEIQLSAEGEPTRLSFEGIIGRDAAAPWYPEMETSALALELDGVFKKGAASFAISLRPDSAEVPLIRWPGHMELRGDLVLKATAALSAENARWSGEMSLLGDGLEIHGPAWAGEGIGLNARFVVAPFDPAVIGEATDVEGLANQLAQAVSGRLEWQSNRMVSGDIETRWLAGNLMLGESGSESPVNVAMEASTGILTLMGEPIQQVRLAAEAKGTFASLDLSGEIGFLHAGSESGVLFQQTVSTPVEALSIRGEYTLKPLTFDYSDLLSRHVAALQGLSFSGVLEGGGTYWLDGNGADASLSLRFSDASVSYPASKITAEGIELKLDLASLVDLVGDSGESYVEVARVRAGDLSATDGLITFDLRNNTVVVTEAGIDTFGGRVALRPTIVTLEPLEFNGVVVFERLSLGEIAGHMEFFDGTMEGVISGRLPFTFADHQLRLREGQLTLPPGETATLHYNAAGLFDEPDSGEGGAGKSLGDRLLGILELDPETVVEDALGDLTITRMRIDLFREETPLTPVRIQLSGEAVSGETRVPLHLETNINGTAGELYNFLIRLNSIGSASF